MKKLIAALTVVAVCSLALACYFAWSSHQQRIQSEDGQALMLQVEQLTAENTRIQTENQALEDQRLTMASDQQETYQQLADVTGERDRLQTEVNAAADRIGSLEDDLSALNKELEAARADAAEKSETIAALTAEKEQADADAAARETVIKELTAAKEAAEAEAAAQADAVQALTAANEKLTAANEELTAANEKLTADAAALQETAAALTAEKEQTEKDAAERSKEIDALTAAKEQAESRIAELEETVSSLKTAKDQAIAALTGLTAPQDTPADDAAEKDEPEGGAETGVQAADGAPAAREPAEADGQPDERAESAGAYVVVRSCDENGVIIAPDVSLTLPQGVSRVYPQNSPELDGYELAGFPYQDVTVDENGASPAVVTFVYQPSGALIDGDLGGGTVTSPGGKVNLRAGPGMRFGRLALLPAGTRVRILGTAVNEEGAWYYVLCGGQQGYIMEDFLQPDP